VILVLQSPRQRPIDLAAALPGHRCAVVIAESAVDGPLGAAAVGTVASYWTPEIVAAGLELAARHRIGRVVSFAEADVLAAAVLRDRLDLPGQRSSSAHAYRDKAWMRACTDQAGVPGPRWAPVTHREHVVAFVRTHGLPAVLKPRRSSGSVGVRVLRGAAELATLPAALPDHLVEQYVEGKLVHVDGMLADGERVFALPSEYTEHGCLAHWADAGSGSLLIPHSDSRHAPLVDALWAVVDALPPAPDLLLHAEFFVAPDRPPVLCEIASRLPGHPIPPMIDRALGRSLREVWLRHAGGASIDLTGVRAALAGSPLVANFGLPPRLGTLLSMPAAVPAETQHWIHDLLPIAGVGDTWDAARYGARKSGDFVLTWTVTANDLPTLRARLARSAELFEAVVRWGPLEGGQAA
jgi:hypothetical protein